MNYIVEPIEVNTRAAVAMEPCPGFLAGTMWALQIDDAFQWRKPVSIRVHADLEALLRSRGIGAAKLERARTAAVFRGAVTWRGDYQDEILDWIADRHGHAVTWAETEVQTSAGEVPALLALSGDKIVACVAPVVSRAEYERHVGARLERIEKNH